VKRKGSQGKYTRPIEHFFSTLRGTGGGILSAGRGRTGVKADQPEEEGGVRRGGKLRLSYPRTTLEKTVRSPLADAERYENLFGEKTGGAEVNNSFYGMPPRVLKGGTHLPIETHIFLAGQR